MRREEGINEGKKEKGEKERKREISKDWRVQKEEVKVYRNLRFLWDYRKFPESGTFADGKRTLRK